VAIFQDEGAKMADTVPWHDPRPGKRCKHCATFATLNDGKCPKDGHDRARIYALDYTCDAFQEIPN
jgi:hypothetical protein